jgi:hypothetical protein
VPRGALARQTARGRPKKIDARSGPFGRTPAYLDDFDDPHCGFDGQSRLDDGNWGDYDYDSGS